MKANYGADILHGLIKNLKGLLGKVSLPFSSRRLHTPRISAMHVLAILAGLSLVLTSISSIYATNDGNNGNNNNNGSSGNDGTVKIHEGSTEVEPQNNNEPKVCTFHLHGFDFDDNSSGTWEIQSWPPTGDGSTVKSGTWEADGSGNWRDPDSGTLTPNLANGHYKLFWNQTDPNAPGNSKQKTFWVECEVTPPVHQGHLTVNKVLSPSNDSGEFNLLIDGTIKATNVGNGGTTGSVTVDSGAHTVSETAGTEIDLDDYQSVISGDCDSNGNITISDNDNKTCTITNTRIIGEAEFGTVIVTKDVQTSTGAAVSDNHTFQAQLNGGTATNFSENSSASFFVTPGAVTVTEVADANYTFVSCTPDSDSNVNGAQLTVGANQTVTVTCVNRQKATTTVVIPPTNGGAVLGATTILPNTGIGGSALPSFPILQLVAGFSSILLGFKRKLNLSFP